ncbi:MAG: hypothetical protein DWQ34_03075 [Planctomycetota bacterium]|nr:MAG: hypothetical protein DWQ34_03075 [Planctomycetota bacterium]REK21498.1 MAG: hypothetical protein DWQ41_21305 [Planctomycetota bacterium]REK34335.1 MAG: hypothetical protein DWQ45_13745 [Planctomycetota bacterium]
MSDETLLAEPGRSVDDALRNILLSVDHATACEAPPSFDWSRAIERVRAIQAEVQSITGRQFEIDENVQDGSFFTDLATYDEEPRPEGSILRHTVLALRFSAFGDLFTTWSVCSNDAKLDPRIIDRVISVARRAGFVYVVADDLEAEYTGSNPHLAGTSWWVRYFDYL